MNKQKGIALLQVLLISGLLGMMAVFFLQSAKTNTYKAIEIGNLAKAEQLAGSAESQLLFSLLTKDKSAARPGESIDNTEQTSLSSLEDEVNEGLLVALSTKWNFYGKPFELQRGVTVELQDANGLVSVFYGDNAAPFKQLLQYHGLSGQDAEDIAFKVHEWQGVNKSRSLLNTGRNGQRSDVMPGAEDILKLPDLDKRLAEKLVPLIYPWSKPFFNPLIAPEPVLAALYGEDIAGEMVRLRQEGGFNRRAFINLTGIDDDEFYVFEVTHRIRMNITARVGDSVVKRTGFWYIRPESLSPVISLH